MIKAADSEEALAIANDTGGIRNSGLGREGGRASIEEMTKLKWITVQLGQRQFPF